ncbi:MAG: Nramp family divalent metal transporter [Bacteroidota bacterium]|nr:Nramp family divalent metal transporter [Bacteroidota bacterium]
MSVDRKSLEEVHGTVDTTKYKNTWRRLLAFLGPAYLVSVGYMDPGNWATDIAGGSQFGYTLIWVLVLSNLMALLLQSLSARLGLASGLDLAQASRAHYPKGVNFFLWILAEIAIAACDLAEVIGMAIGLQLLFGLSLLTGVCITVFDTFLLLILQKYGIRRMEAFIIGLVSVIGMAFIVELFFAKPSIPGILSGLKPIIPNDAALYITIGIIGATVMPHNLYLHSSLVQTRKIGRTPKGIWEAIKFNVIDSFIALNLALFVNAAILILAASAFDANGYHTVTSIQKAHTLLQNIFGNVAPTLFAIALIAAGQSSTLTGTLSGQIVMEGYLNIRLQPWMRRLITRLVAIIPAVITLLVFGEEKMEGLLILSQVVLSLQLGFAVIPLIHFVSNKKLMGEFVATKWLIIPAWLTAIIIVSLNGKLVFNTLQDAITESSYPILIWLTAVPVTIAVAFLLVWITIRPLVGKALHKRDSRPHDHPHELHLSKKENYARIAVCVDFSTSDSEALSHAIQQGGKSAAYLLLHITETAGARVMNSETGDFETEFDQKELDKYAEKFRREGYTVETTLGFGNPKETIPKIVNEANVDLLVMGAHGHNLLKDLLFGTTVEKVRHKVKVPVLIVRK